MTAADKPPTMRSRVDLLVEQVARLTDDLDRRMQPVATASRRYTEADALNACIDALDLIARNDTRTTYPAGAARPMLDRILRFLAARYSVDLIEVRTDPCARRHVDSIDAYALADLVASAATS